MLCFPVYLIKASPKTECHSWSLISVNSPFVLLIFRSYSKPLSKLQKGNVYFSTDKKGLLEGPRAATRGSTVCLQSPVSEEEKVLLTGAPWRDMAWMEMSFSITFTLTGVFRGDSAGKILIIVALQKGCEQFWETETIPLIPCLLSTAGKGKPQTLRFFLPISLSFFFFFASGWGCPKGVL